MKASSDPRHIVRVAAVKNLFASSFKGQDLNDPLATKVLDQKKEIDGLIHKNAPAWPVNQISPIDLAVLRLAIFELIFKDKKEPYKVVVDEAVEISKEYGNDSSASFINGVLGSIIKSQHIAEENNK